MIDRIEKYFLGKYDNSDYIIRVKTRMWFYVMILMFFLSVFIYVSLTVFNLIPMMIWHITIPSMMLVPMCSLYLVKKGYNFASADLFFVILSVVTLLGMYLRYRRNPDEIYMTTFYLVTVVILGASVFCRVYWVYVYTTVFFISNIIIIFFTMSDKHEQLTAVFKQSFLYSTLSLIFTFLLSLFIRITTNRALKSVQEELAKNINLNKDLGEKHSIFQEVAGQLEQHFNVLKISSADFEDNSQNTAVSIEEISSTAEEVMSGVEQVFDVINEQYHGLMILLKKMEELSGITAGISEQIQKVSRSTEEVTSMAQEGTEVLKQMHSGMSRVSESAYIMENIVLIINDIADKINLLSLNASIEAARAGVTGRDFQTRRHDPVQHAGNKQTHSFIE